MPPTSTTAARPTRARALSEGEILSVALEIILGGIRADLLAP